MPPNRQLKQEREQRGWSQAHLAEQVGVDVMTVRRWESGFSRPYPIYRERLCTLFGKSVQELGLLPAENEHVESAATLLLDPALPFALGQAADLVGRETFLQDLKQRLFAGDTLALTALNGLPGIGKSALAVALAVDKEVQAHFHDGILWAGLGPQPQVLSLLTRWGAQLGLMPFEVEEASGWESWYRALHARIGVRRFLLIIDDAWSVEDALALQVGGPHCVHLLTTRQPAVALAFAPQVITVQELGEDEGVSLLARFVPQLVEQEAESARALVRAVGGLPLALTLIGRYLAMQRVGGQPRRMHTALAQVQQTQQRMQLSMPVPTQKAQSPSLQATIAISDRRLSALAQATLRALALFPPKPNSFSEEGALAVSGTQVETLDELWDAGMLESSGAGRYTLHQTIADYARSQAEGTEAPERLVRFLLGYVQQHERAYDLLEPEVANILAALEMAVERNMTQELIQGVIAFVSFLRVRGLYAQADSWLQQALIAAQTLGDAQMEMTCLCHLAAFAQLRGDYTQAEVYGQKGLALANHLEDHKTASSLLTTLGRVAFLRGEAYQAMKAYEEGLQIARQEQDNESICTLSSYLADVLRLQGHLDRAEALCREGLVLARQNGHQESEGLLLAALGAIMTRRGNFAQTEAYFLEGLELARHVGHRDLESRLLLSLGAIAHYRGKFEEAVRYIQEALALARQTGHREHICNLLGNLGSVLVLLRDYQKAEMYLLEALALARELGRHEQLPILLINLGEVNGYLGNYQRANAYFRESVELARQQEATWSITAAHIYWGELHLRYQQVEAAEAAFEEGLTLNQKGEQDPGLRAEGQYGLAQIAALRGEVEKAYSLGKETLQTFETMGHYRTEATRQWLAGISDSDV